MAKSEAVRELLREAMAAALLPSLHYPPTPPAVETAEPCDVRRLVAEMTSKRASAEAGGADAPLKDEV